MNRTRMETNGGSGFPRNSEISLVKLKSKESLPPTKTSNGDDHAQSQNLAPLSSAEALPNWPPKVNGGPKLEIDKLAFKRNPSIEPKPRTTEIDIIGVPAIGGDPEKTWMPEAKFAQENASSPRGSEVKSAFMSMALVTPAYSQSPSKQSTMKSLNRMDPPWITGGIRKDLHMARVLLYDHGFPKDGDTLKQLANRLLDNIGKLRSIEGESRPLFFICHSTGGLVVKIALNEARRCRDPILHDCYGVTFFATPHRGSSYLSQPGFSTSIRGIMGLSRELPISITKQLEPDHHSLQQIGKDFKALATDLKVWTFFETLDSDLTSPDQGKPFHAPITSIKSAILNLRNETVYPLMSTHTKCAAFGSENVHTKESYLQALAASVKKACELSKTIHSELNLEERIEVEINGFYEGTTMTPKNELPIRVWSTNRSMQDFMRDGPTKLLEERRAEASVAPVVRQYLRHDTRARSLLQDQITFSDKDKGNSVNPKSTLKLNLFKRGSSPPPLSRRGRALKDEDQSKPLADTIGMKKTAPSPPTLVMTTDADNDIDTSAAISADVEARVDLNSSPPLIQSTSSRSGLLNTQPRASSDQWLANPDHRFGIIPTLQPPPIESQIVTDNIATRSGPLRRHSEAQPSHISFLSPPGAAGIHRNKSSSSLGLQGNESAVTTIPLPLQDPSSSKLKLKWIHVPFNNPTWVQDVLARISVEKGPDIHSRMLDAEHWHSKHMRGRHQEHHHACYLKPHCSFFGLENVSPKLDIGPVDINHVQMCLYLPYLHFDTYKVLVKRRALVKQRLKQGRSRPVPQKVAKFDSEEFQVLWQYLGHDPPINVRRTLDQFGYPSLLDTRARDDDQMLYKMTKERFVNSDLDTDHSSYGENKAAQKTRKVHEDEEEEDDEIDENSAGSDSPSDSDIMSDDDVLDGNVLMVDQLWLWIIDSVNDKKFANSLQRAGLKTDGRLYQQADLRNSIFNEVNADLTSRCENAYDLAALVALHAVTILFERTSHPDLEVFRTFEEAISILSFRARGFRDKAEDIDDLRTTSIRAKHRREGQVAEKQNRDNTSALLELRDIEDELNTLKILFTSQTTEIKNMLEIYEKRELTTNGLMFLKSAEDYLEEYTQHVERMIESVRSTRDDLPLSFFTGLFGMNVQEWGGGDFLPLRTVGVIASMTPFPIRTKKKIALTSPTPTVPTSSALISLALIVAWSTRIRRLFQSIGATFTHLYVTIHGHISKTINNIFDSKKTSGKRSKIRGLRQRKKKRRLEKERTRSQDEDWDFWGSHKERREKDYKMPSQNRKSGFGMAAGVGGK
ncbi:hypothetical protein NHQ30_003747 [Ciborinia camelliae]|nr:hypothetical protein NHQ30_003747 [Ciborinia camelliae]